jgi:hypothetical protein
LRKISAGLIATLLLLVTALAAVNGFAVAKPTAAQAPLTTPAIDALLADAPLAGAKWTIIVYLAADNNLQAAGLGDLDEMELVGSVGAVNVIVLMDTLDAVIGTHWYYVGTGQNHIDLANETHDCDCLEIAGGCPGELNMGDPATLDNCLEKAIEFAPADNYMLVLWDHGGGWWGVCYDDSSQLPSGSTDRLTMDEVQTGILAATPNGKAVDLSIIGYDACFMGMVEIAYENRNLADLMVASITTVPGDGWDYTAWLTEIQKTAKTPYDIAQKAAQTYVEFYSICAGAGLGGFPFTSMGVYDLTKVGALVTDGINPLAKALIPLTEQYDLRGIIQSSESQTPQIQFHGEAFPFTDIGWYVTLLGEKMPDLQVETERVFTLLKDTMMYFEYVTPDADMCLRSYGMSIYYTISSDKLYDNYRTSGLDFVDNTQWDDFLWALAMTA